jgi:hypothetical protein
MMEDLKAQLIQEDIALINGLNKEIRLLESLVDKQDKIIEMQQGMLDKVRTLSTEWGKK